MPVAWLTTLSIGRHESQQAVVRVKVLLWVARQMLLQLA
jgi:hypothetical protein